MLVTLGSGASISAGASQTFQYACNSAQQVYVRTEDAADSLDGHITVQIGNDVIVNDINFQALAYLGEVTGGANVASSHAGFKVDLGSHVLEGEENLYVTIRNADGASALDAVDVSAIVNESGVYQPLKYTNYSDNVFTDTNTLSVYAWSTADLDEDTTAFTIRNQAYSSTPQVQSGCSVSQCNSWTFEGGSTAWKRLSTLAQNQVPMNTSINYSSATITGVICISAMDKMPSKARASAQAGRAVVGGMTSSERKAL